MQSLHIHIAHRSRSDRVQVGFLTSGKEVLVSVVTAVQDHSSHVHLCVSLEDILTRLRGQTT